MKHLSFRTCAAIAVIAAGLSITACKSKNGDTDAVISDSGASMNIEPQQDNVNVKPDATPVTVSPDDSLTTMAKDAVKDYPGVTATVSNGEVTLTGEITRAKLPNLMQAVQAMRPKKVNNNLTIK